MKRTVDALTDGTFDLLILGGGITGAGVALDAALRGLRVALIDKSDFASGTSSVSSKLVHGGIRYLEYGQFPLVYEALHKRTLLLANAPHLVPPLAFVNSLLCCRPACQPGDGALGLTLYDLLARAGDLHRGRRASPWAGAGAGRVPHLAGGGGCTAAAGFLRCSDGRMPASAWKWCGRPAREGAVVANYVEAVAFEQGSGVLSGVHAVDHLSGQELLLRASSNPQRHGALGGRRLPPRAACTTGPYLQPTKGVHLVAPDRGLTAAFLLLHPGDGRVFFVIPWLGKTLIGTADTLSTEGPRCADRHPHGHRVPAAGIQPVLHTPPEDPAPSLSSFVGLRPLISRPTGRASSLSREFRLFRSPSGLLSVAGGNITTYRRMAEIITDVIVRRLRPLAPQDDRGGRSLRSTPRAAGAEFARTESSFLQAQHALSASPPASGAAYWPARTGMSPRISTRTPSLARRWLPESRPAGGARLSTRAGDGRAARGSSARAHAAGVV